MTSPAEALNDAQLIDRVRADDAAAFAELRRRHQSDAARTARITAYDPDEADRVADAAFEHLHAALTAGEGPRTSVSLYLRTMIRRGTLDAHRSPGEEYEAADAAAVDDLPYTSDPLTAVEERNIVREAYESLPERWQRALWFTEIEGRTPAALVPDLGSAASAVAAMAYRAREGLRQAYLAVHMSVAVSAECQPIVATLPAYVRETLSPEDDVAVAIHLDTCAECRNRRYELLLLVTNLRNVLAPALLGYRAGTPAATRPIGFAGASAAGVAAAAGRAARTSVAAMAAVGRWPQRAIKVAATAAVCVLAAAALAWAASSAFAPTTSADAAGDAREPLAVTFEEQTTEPAPPPVTITPTDLLDGLPTETEDPAESDATEPGSDDDPVVSADAGTAGEPTGTSDSGNNTSGREPADSTPSAPAGGGAAAGAGGGSSDADAGNGGNQNPSDGSDSDPDQQPAPPAGNDGDSDDEEEDEPTGPDNNPDEEEQEKRGLLETVFCGLFSC